MSSDPKRVSLPAGDASRWKADVRRYGLPSRDVELYALNPAQAEAEIQTARRPLNDEYVLASVVAQATTPPQIADALAGLGLRGEPDAAVIDLGRDFVEADPDREMPVRGRRNPGKPFGSDEVALLGIVQSSSQPMSLVSEAGLDLIMPVSPAPGHEATRSSKGGARLGWHVDNLPFRPPYRPDFLALMGLVATEPVATSFALIDDVLRALRRVGGGHERVLRQPRFRYHTPASFHLDGSPAVLSDPMPVIGEGQDGREVFNFNEYSIVADRGDPEVAASLDVLGRVLCDEAVVRHEVVLRGKVLVLSNTRALHARGEVRGRRYLARLYGKRDLSALRALPSGGDRVCRYRFSMTAAEMVASCREFAAVQS